MGQLFVLFCYVQRLTHPSRETLDEYMDLLIPKVRYFGEDLSEDHFYKRQRWLQLQDNNDDVILHIFEPRMAPEQITDKTPGSDYLKVTNGDVVKGVWSIMKGNKMILVNPNHQLYDLGFLNNYIFILRKHGDNTAIGQSKYIVLVSEYGIRRIMLRALGTREVSRETLAELLYHYYAYNNFITGFIIVGVPLFLFLLYIIF